MRKFLTPAFVAGLLLVGCTSGDDETSDGSGGTDTTAAATDTTAGGTDTTAAADTPTGPAPGVTDTAVRIGVNIVDTEALAASGINIDTGDIEGAYNVLADEINEAGGINGRQIELVFALIDPTSPQPAEDACLRLTEDEDVFATIGFFLGDAVLCTVDTHATAVVGGTQSPDTLARAQAPWFSFESADGELDSITAFAEAGELDGQVALLSNLNDAALTEQVTAHLEELGVELVTDAVIDAPNNDTVALQNAVLAISQSFESAGVDTVLAIGQAGSQWATSLQDQPYRPELRLTNDTIGAFIESDATRDFSVLDGAIRGGLYGPFQAMYEEAGMQECIGRLEAAGIEIVAPDDAPEGQQPFYAGFDSCRHMTLLAALLEAAGPELNYGTFAQAGAELGEIAIPGDPEPANYGPDSPDGDVAQHLFTFDPDAREFVLSE